MTGEDVGGSKCTVPLSQNVKLAEKKEKEQKSVREKSSKVLGPHRGYLKIAQPAASL